MNILPCLAKETADVIKLRTLQWGDYPGFSGNAQSNYMGFLIGELFPVEFGVRRKWDYR